MKSSLRALLAAISVCGYASFAETSELKIPSDLVLHPSQLATFFSLSAGKIQQQSSLDWDVLNFEKPYKTSWHQVHADGPFSLAFDSSRLAQQELSFEMSWVSPQIKVGRFEIHDTIVREVGGAQIVIHLDGACSNMALKIPNAGWKAKGTLVWGWNGSDLQVQWRDFQFSAANLSGAQVDLGQCEGPQGLQQALRETLESVSKDQNWMRDAIKEGLLSYVSDALDGLQEELLKSRTTEVRRGLVLSWEPSDIGGLANGLIRVSGSVFLRKPTAVKVSDSIERSQPEAQLELTQESGFILPKSTVPKIFDFLYRIGELRYRVTSNKIQSFKDLMENRFVQFFVWPDLMNFASDTQFYFDLNSERVPTFSNGRMTYAGVAYNVSVPLVINQWAPAATRYVPYLDLRAPLTGVMTMNVVNDKLQMAVQPSSMSVSAAFRPEYSSVRPTNPWLATPLFGSALEDYLKNNSLSFGLPTWTVNGDLKMGVKDVQVWKQSFRIPIDFKNSK